MIQLSIVIPVYNVHEYLPKCLESLWGQVVETIEVILVNDGSTDNSLAVCQDFAKKYVNTIVIDKENGGLSDARNVGTEAASGEYVYYLDSDDWLALGAIKSLYDFAVANNCDIVQGGFYYAYDDHLLYDNRYKNPFVLNRHDAMQQLIRNDYVKNFAWGKIYRADTVKRYPFPKGKFYEDSYWQHHVMHDVTQYGIIPTPLYYYRQRDTGISGGFSLKNLDLLVGYEERLKFIQMNYPEFIFEMATCYYKVLSQYMQCALQLRNEEVKQVFMHYQQEVMEKYRYLFDAALKHSLKYRIQRDIPFMYPTYEFAERVYDHFFSSCLKRKDL